MSRTRRVLVASVLMLLGTNGRVVRRPSSRDVPRASWRYSGPRRPADGLTAGGRDRPPVLALTVALAGFVVAPVPASRWLAVLLGAILGGAIGAAAFFAPRPLTMDGFDSGGTWISVPRPLDPYAFATAIILAALLGTIVMRLVLDVRRVRRAQS
jgi:hypothetical protein